MITLKGWPQGEGPAGYAVFRDEQEIGFISTGGFFNKNTGMTLTYEEEMFIKDWCKKIYGLPSEYGCLGVGEKPTKPLDEKRCGI